jgi:hypothetical protein
MIVEQRDQHNYRYNDDLAGEGQRHRPRPARPYSFEERVLEHCGSFSNLN